LNFEQIQLPKDLAQTLAAIYQKAAKHNPKIDQDSFVRQVIMEWLEPYGRQEEKISTKRSNVMLKNSVKVAIDASGKTITQVAKEIGVNRVYLSKVINEQCEPSVVVLLLLLESLRVPTEKIKELFYLEPVTAEE